MALATVSMTRKRLLVVVEAVHRLRAVGLRPPWSPLPPAVVCGAGIAPAGLAFLPVSVR
jgi:hypothetical protein